MFMNLPALSALPTAVTKQGFRGGGLQVTVCMCAFDLMRQTAYVISVRKHTCNDF